MNENNNFNDFDNLFVEEKQEKIIEQTEKNPKPFLFSILAYFVVFFLVATLVQMLFIINKNNIEKMSSTEATIEYLENDLGYSFATESDYNNSKNKDSVLNLQFENYYIIYSKELKDDEEFMGLLDFVSGEDVTNLFKNDSPYLKILNDSDDDFLNDYNLTIDNFDFTVTDYTGFKNSIAATINFITYVFAMLTIPLLLWKVIKTDFKKLDKTVKVFISMALIGYLYMIAGNVITNFATTIIRLITNTKDSTSINQAAINKMLKSNYAILMIIPVVFFAPIVEELVFRKSIFGLIKNDIVALVVSSVLFGLIHVIGETNIIDFVVNLVSYSIPGFALGLFYMKSNKNIIAPMLAHAFSNLVSVILILFLF